MAPTTYDVRWTATAEKDLEEIIDFIARDSIPAAKAALQRIRELCSTLDEMPTRGRVVPELKEQGIVTYHELQTPPWRIIYRISNDRVFVLAVFDARRNLADLLLERFIR